MVITIIIIIIIVLCFTLILFSIIKKNKEMDSLTKELYTFKNIGMSGGNDVILDNIPSSFPQVSVLTNNIIQTIPKGSFVWLEKTDGLRNVIIIENNKVYSIVKGSPNFLFNIEGDKFIRRSILDTEFYQGKYYIFDAVMINGEDISDKFFIDRMDNAEDLLLNNTNSNIFILKEYYNIESWDKLLSFIENYTSPLTGNVIDGIICQRIDMPYFATPKDPACFKLKRKVMNTIDFYLRYQKDDGIFYLYLYGSYSDYIFNLKKLPRINKYMMVHTGIDISQKLLPKSMYTLFASPYEEGLHKFIPRNDWNTEGYFPENINEINKLMNDIMNDPLSFDKKIVEMSLANDGWVPMRIRTDKEFSNGYYVGLMNCGTIFSPVTGKEGYFTKKFAFDENILNPYHEINKIMRKYIIEHSINSLEKNKLNVLDLAGGRGGDELSLFHAGATNIFAVDADRDALVQYVNRTSLIPKMKWDKLLQSTKDLAGKSIFINAVYAMLGKNNDKYINDIKHRFEYPRDGFDVILMNYAIHYICYSHECIKALNTMIQKLLKPGGLFIFSCFDGDMIMNDIKLNNGELKLKTFNIKLIDPQMKESDMDSQWANMPLPTIDSSGYRPEPLVQKKWLADIKLKTLDHYYPLEKCESYISGIENKELVSDYLKYIQVFVMSKS